MKGYKIEVIKEHLSVNGWDDTAYTVSENYYLSKEKALIIKSTTENSFKGFNKHFKNGIGDRYIVRLSEINIEE